MLKGCKLLCVNTRCHFCQNLGAFYVFSFSRHLFHFAAEFVTLSYTKMTIFLTLQYTASLKKAPFLGGASPYSPLQGVPHPPGNLQGIKEMKRAQIAGEELVSQASLKFYLCPVRSILEYAVQVWENI